MLYSINTLKQDSNELIKLSSASVDESKQSPVYYYRILSFCLFLMIYENFSIIYTYFSKMISL